MRNPNLTFARLARAILRAGTAVLVLASLLVLAPQRLAHADHGSWTLHEYVVNAPNNADYEGWARTNASNPYDFGYARFTVTKGNTAVINESRSCGEVNEGCRLVKTAPRIWRQGSASVQGTHCAYDKFSGTRHFLEGASSGVCSGFGSLTHSHGVVVG